ncbi:trypsin-like peptidase domain-containing protein [Commensalibacter papalotli (ex Botero et al. 2024)]|uniref:S1-C subfamily n=1 Tax=Commensalibacter papalotli (ex Botero et al. 2024) TaxID=2972766 RepID=A0ABN8W5K1_9PROT|nr:trypsin-like peptidase domain-containing protein [Commensalibacter papalotli (ex Botero et al. 2024)]CAI3925750.1 Periplasmic serine protease [Commensalibacter papalotli (ex Botero et al. 2024)]CAI3926302.1 Periplasmic serine protease [Commensalibacter papalotli (ex Botero et al. 2024)]
MALYLLGKTSFYSSEDIVINGRIIYEQYPQIAQILKKHCPTISLAEPTITANKESDDSFISWYADTKTEPTLPLENQQDFVEQKLAEAITSLSDAYPEGSADRALLNAALSVQNKQDILIANDQIVIKGWGQPGLSLFSQFTPQKEIPPLTESLTEQQQAAPLKTVPPVMGTAQAMPRTVVGSMNKMPIYLTRLVAAVLFFIIGLFIGWRLIYAERPTKIAKIPVIEAQDLVRKKPEIEKKNKDLEDEIKKLEEQLKNPPCDLEKSRAAPELNKSLDNSSTPMKSDGKNFQGSLPELLEKSTVFILVKAKDEDGDEGVAMGSGFFATPELIVTNRHVVENSEDNTVLVTNKALGQFKKAHIMSISDRSSDVNSFDLAVLKIEDAPPQQPLSFTLEAQPLQTVVAAGYPGMILRQDGALKRLAQGDITAIPGVVLTKGEINAIQVNSNGEKVIPHSAAVSPGNSGGALVDLCGRVVGVNTFVTMDKETSSHSNYAQKSDAIVRALQNANIPIQVKAGACNDTTPSQSSEPEKNSDTPNKSENHEESTAPPDQKNDATKPEESKTPSVPTVSEKKPDTSSNTPEKQKEPAVKPDQKSDANKENNNKGSSENTAPKADQKKDKIPSTTADKKPDQPSATHGDKP